MGSNYKIRVVGTKVVLVPYEIYHVEKYHSWMQCPKLLEQTGSDRLTLEEEYKSQQSWVKDDKKCTFIVLDKEIWERTENEIESMIGDVNLHLEEQEDLIVAEIGVMIADPVHRGKGKAKDALLCMLLYGMEVLSLTTFTAKIGMENEQSLRLFSNLGFMETGKNEFFKHIEMTCYATTKWKNDLKSKREQYSIELI